MDIIRAMAEKGNPNSVSDAGVAALAARSAVWGAWLNVKINAKGLDDSSRVSEILDQAADMAARAAADEKEILEIVNRIIDV